MAYFVSFNLNLLTGVFDDVLVYSQILLVVWAHSFTGHNNGSTDQWRLMGLFLFLFFWSLKVMPIRLAVWMSWELWGISLLLEKIEGFISIEVFLSSWFETFKYLHDCMQKKIAPIHRSVIVRSNLVTDCLFILLKNTHWFCFFVFLFWVCFFIAFVLLL